MDRLEIDGTPAILHVIRSKAWGGLEIYVDILIKKLHTAGIKTGVYCLPDSLIYKSLKAAGVPVYDAISSRKISLEDIRNIRKIIRKEKFDILHSHSNADVWLCSPALILDDRRRHLYSLYMTVIAKRNFVHLKLYEGIDLLISTSEKINEDVKRKYPIHINKVELQRYGREVYEYTKDEEKRGAIRLKYAVNKDDIVVGTMCRMDRSKGVVEFAKSFKFLPEELRSKMQFWLIGDRTTLYNTAEGQIVYEKESEETYEQIRDFIKENHLENKIKLIPFQQELQGYISALDIFVLGSYNEMYALAVLDAMLMEKPVIGTNAGGTPEQIGNNERGILVEPKSPESIASAIEYMVKNPAEALRMASKAREWVLDQHNWENVLPQYLEKYRQLKR